MLPILYRVRSPRFIPSPCFIPSPYFPVLVLYLVCILYPVRSPYSEVCSRSPCFTLAGIETYILLKTIIPLNVVWPGIL